VVLVYRPWFYKFSHQVTTESLCLLMLDVWSSVANRISLAISNRMLRSTLCIWFHEMFQMSFHACSQSVLQGPKLGRIFKQQVKHCTKRQLRQAKVTRKSTKTLFQCQRRVSHDIKIDDKKSSSKRKPAPSSHTSQRQLTANCSGEAIFIRFELCLARGQHSAVMVIWLF